MFEFSELPKEVQAHILSKLCKTSLLDALGIQSKGYEEFTGDNLIINIGVIGRCTNTSTTKYKVEINAIIEAMASKGIQFIKPMKIDSEVRAGEEWNLSKFLNNSRTITPREA